MLPWEALGKGGQGGPLQDMESPHCAGDMSPPGEVAGRGPIYLPWSSCVPLVMERGDAETGAKETGETPCGLTGPSEGPRYQYVYWEETGVAVSGEDGQWWPWRSRVLVPSPSCPHPFSSMSSQVRAGPGGIPVLGAHTSPLGPWVLRGVFVKRSH